jgi:glycosyltransferase involved in cell wall biosynthesis
MQEKILALGGLQPARVECIPCSGYDPDVFKPRSRAALRVGLGLAPDARLVAFVGNLVPLKGVDVLLRAWAALQASRSSETLAVQDRLVLIGNGAQRSRLEQLAASLGITSAVAFLGAVPQQVVSDWIGAADLLCLPSHCEGSPNVVVESLASGVPVVASRVGGVPDLVTQGVNGYLVPPGDPVALAQALGAAFETAWNADAISASVAHLDWRRLAQRNIELLATIRATA